MAKLVSDGDGEILNQVAKVEEDEAHPYAFHVSGPRNLTTLNWRDLINSSWKDPNYKRTVIACFIQAVYLLELDRQENRSQSNALAPHWWIPFKYKLTKTLIDERDGSIFGAILEWDRSAAMADLVLIRPSGAPKAVLALRGTILKGPTMRRDIEDDLRFLAWESLKGSVRFSSALEALRSACDAYGSSNVCVSGHSLGAGFALQVGKALAKEGVYVDTHLFNPPSVSIAMSFRNIGEKAEFLWKKVKKSFVSNPDPEDGKNNPNVGLESGSGSGLSSWMTRLTSWKGTGRWVPHLYVNNSDYICCSYTDPVHGGDDGRAREGEGDLDGDKENVRPMNGGGGGSSGGQTAAKLFVVRKEKQRFLEAHGLEQWWSSDAELQLTIHNSKLITRQLKSLYNVASTQITQGKGKLK